MGLIAAAGLRAAPLRTAAIAVPVLLAVGTAVCVLGSGATMGAAIQRQTEQALLADGVVTAKPGTELSVTPGTMRGVTATALVATELTVSATTDDDQPETNDAWGVQGDSLRRFLDLDVQHGRLADLGEGTFAAGTSEVEDNDWRLGQSVALRLSDGSAQTLRLVAVYHRDLAFPAFLLPRSTALAHTAHPHAEQILLSGDIRGWPGQPGQELSSRAEYLDHLTPRSPQDDLAGHLIVAVIAGYALLAAANTCALAQRDRRAQRAHLRALGLGRLQLARCVLYEVLGAALVGLGLAVATALVCLPPFSPTNRPDARRLLEALPQLSLTLHDAPDALQRTLYDVTQLAIQVDHDQKEITTKIKIPEDRIDAVAGVATRVPAGVTSQGVSVQLPRREDYVRTPRGAPFERPIHGGSGRIDQ